MNLEQCENNTVQMLLVAASSSQISDSLLSSNYSKLHTFILPSSYPLETSIFLTFENSMPAPPLLCACWVHNSL